MAFVVDALVTTQWYPKDDRISENTVCTCGRQAYNKPPKFFFYTSVKYYSVGELFTF